jgi:eukaryotic-like serine/threonine-protein kinase
MTGMTGQSIGRYHILQQLGEGGMATVYKAYDTRLERDVAIKIIRRGAFPPEQLERILKRFEREAKALARLSHANIVKVHDYGEYEGAPFLVMEYLPGGTLKEKMGKPIPWQNATSLLLPVARALDYAHQQGILHRDVKPSNILLTETGEPMLTDFGIAKILDIEETHTLTGTGVGIGTPEYMAPEQGIGEGVDARADIYSLGIIFYELITGRKPYTADTPMAVVIKQINEPLPSPRQFVPELPDGVEKVLLKAVAKSPENRYPVMGAFAAALESLLGGSVQVTGQRPEQPAEERTVDTFGLPTGGIPMPETGQRSHAQKPWLKWLPLGGVIVLVCLVLAAGAVYLLRKNINATKTWIAEFVSGTPSYTPTATIESKATHALSTTPTLTPTRMNARVSSIDGMVLLEVAEGDFIMGNDVGRENEMPSHTVWLDTFRIDQTEVTNSMYEKCVQAGTCRAPLQNKSFTRKDYYGNPEFGNFPVIAVLWEDAKAYCTWADRRLPTEAEWEKAARGTDGNIYPWGNAFQGVWVNFCDRNCKNGNANEGFNDGYADTSPVDYHPEGASPYGAYDMSGNVWEWVNDWYDANYYSHSPNTNPQGPSTGSVHVLRGGSWGDLDYQVRTTWRPEFKVSPALYSVFGFRCAQSVNP